ncbi:MAG: GerMN domain-containing protein [Bacilli bacterium]|nr:GerMN domain-containing protein [Bacilli bacterium]
MNKTIKKKLKVLIVVGIIILVGIVVAIPKSTYEKWFGNNPQEDSPIVENRKTALVYVKNSAGLLVGLEAPITEEVNDDIREKWDIMTKHASSLPNGYTTTINVNTILNEYVINEGILELYVTSDITSSDGRKTAEAIAWTYINDEISEVKLFVDDIEVKKINDYTITKITKKMGINLEYETSYLFESTSTTVVYYETEYMLPVTYFHTETDVCSYILEKTLVQANITENSSFEYDLQEDVMVINFVDNIELNENVLMSLTESFDLNFNLSKLSINNVEKTLYEAVFNEIEE